MNFTALGFGVSWMSLIFGIAVGRFGQSHQRDPSLSLPHHYNPSMAATLTAREPTTNHPRPGSQNACSKGACGIYSRASLAPLFSKVRQVETEADDCEGRLPPLFLHVPSNSDTLQWICLEVLYRSE